MAAEVERTAVVVGAASGIGAATATALRADGYRVVTADVQAEHVDSAVDVVDEESVSALFDDVLGRFGRLDAVVNTAGVSTLGEVTELAAEEFRRVVDVCLFGAFLVIKHAGRRMSEGGSIVSMASLNARQPGTGMAAYCSAKAGLAMLTEVSALELGASGIRVNAISPGLVETPLTAPALEIPGVSEDYLANMPLGRAGLCEEVAEAVLFACRSRWLTGEVIDLNGGAHLRRYPDLVTHVRKALG